MEYVEKNEKSEVLWGTYERNSICTGPIEAQVRELITLCNDKTLNDEKWSSRMEHNFESRAGLLIDLELIDPILFRHT